MSLRNSFFVFFSILAMAITSNAQAEVSIKGLAEISYTSWGEPDPEEIESAKQKAIDSALSRWASKQGGSFLKNYESLRTQIQKNKKDFVLGTTIVDETTNKDNKNYRVVLKVLLDDVRLKNMVASSSEIANADGDDLSYITLVFVSRRQASVQNYDVKTYKRTDSNLSESGSEYEDATDTGVEYSAESSKTATITSGGSTTRRADKIQYQVASSDTVTTSMTEVFASNRFEVVEAEYLEEETDGLISLAAFKEDFSNGDDISGKTKRNAAKGAKSLEIPYMAIGTLDVGMQDKDPSSGLTRVFVTVTGKLISVEKRFPKTIASVGPIQFSGLGPNQTVAETNALKLASEKAATELVNQMNAKGIK